MKIFNKSTNALIAVFCFTSLGMAATGATEPVDLGTLGGSSSQANAVSVFGAIAGQANLTGDTTQHAFLRPAGSTTLQDLGTLSGGTFSVGLGVNALQQVVGYGDYVDPINGAETHGFFYNKGTLTDVGTLGGPNAEATAINNLGLVAGYSLLSDGATTHAFVYCPEKKSITDLGVLSGGTNSAAYGINDLGLAVGSSETGKVDAFGNAIVDAVIFNTLNKKIIDIGNLGASGAQATAINDLVAVVGFSPETDGNIHGFYFNGGKLVDIGNLGGSYTQATALNIFSEVVGLSNTAGDTDQHAFVWTKKTGIVDLNSVIPANSGWDLNAAYGINIAGEIVGVGTYNGETHAFSLSYPLH